MIASYWALIIYFFRKNFQFKGESSMYVYLLLLDTTGGRRSGVVVSVPESPSRGHCVVFLGKTLYSHSASLHPGV